MGFRDVLYYFLKISCLRYKKILFRGSFYRMVFLDIDYIDGDVIVFSCDFWFDNLKMLSYIGGSVFIDDLVGNLMRQECDCEVWFIFKNEIICVVYILKLKGWCKVFFDVGDSVDVERLSGVLMNVVYVVMFFFQLFDLDVKVKFKKIFFCIYGL